MFTGIVSALGRVAATRDLGSARRIVIDAGAPLCSGWKAGDSVAVSGVCLTLAALKDGRFEADLTGETLARTTLGRLAPGDVVNLEPALAAGAPLGGHLVTGHVDGIAQVLACSGEGGARVATIEAPAALGRFIAEKGSVALDGVSLTVGRVEGAAFAVHLVPHTCTATTLGALAAGAALNLEVDLIARYLDRLLQAREPR